jgi:hypothetical protein
MTSPGGTFENVRSIAESCENLVEDTLKGKYSMEQFAQELRRTGVSAREAEDYVQELKQRLSSRGHSASDVQQLDTNTASSSSATHHTAQEQPTTPDGLDEEQAAIFRAGRTKEPLSPSEINEEVAWALLRSKLEHSRTSPEDSHPSGSISELLKVLMPSDTTTSSIPSSVLAIAPHLSSLSQSTALDEHLHQTWKLRQAYCSEKAMDPIVDLMQCQHLPDPIPRSIWRKIIQDDFVDFERLYGSTDRNCSHQDDQKEFAGDYVLTKKEQVSAKKPITSEAEWTRMFSTWEAAVVCLYPHRQQELQNYRITVVDLFRAIPHNASVAIQFDVEARDRYARSPYRLDNRDMLHIPLLVQLFRGSSSNAKRDADTMSSSQAAQAKATKRAMVPCQNWSLGICNDPCANRRKHGVCSECGGQHKAKDKEGCLTKLQDKRRGGKGNSSAAGRGGSDRA